MKMILSSLLLMLALTGCATNPATKQSDFVMMSEEDELALGQKFAAQVAKDMPLLPETDPLARYVDSVGQKVAKVSDRPELFYRFHVVDDQTINAFALPGGYIYIHRGLLNHLNSEAELAAVLGHELGHVTARHAVQQYSQAKAYQTAMMVTSIFVPMPAGIDQFANVLATAVIRGYGRENELQSDELGIRYLTRAGYDAHAAVNLLETLKRIEKLSLEEAEDTSGEKPEVYHGAFSTHPETEKRIDEAVDLAAAAQSQEGIVNHNAILAAVEGYPYAERAEEGAVVGRHFFHPDVGIQFSVPENWVIRNTEANVQARVRKEKVFFLLRLKELQKRESAEEILKSLFTDRHIGTITNGQKNGFTYARAIVRESAPNVSKAAIDATVWLEGPKAYIMSMWCERDQLDQWQAQFNQIHDSFGHYDKQKDGDIPRIALHVWHQGDSWQSLAAESKQILGKFTAEKFAALNGKDISEPATAGQIVKVVH